jgi:transcriptional regulator with XRE-family HTH domain
MKFSDQIRRAVQDAKLTRYAIHKRTGIDQGSLSRFVKGKANLSLDSIDKLADVLGLTVTTRSEGKATK